MAEPLPRTIGRYEIADELGRGTMGVVYRALDPALGRTVALKTVSLAFAVPDPAEQEVFQKRFLIEARSAAGLSHAGIIVVHDVGRDPDTATLYIALEYLKGRTLAEMTAEGRPLPWREALRVTARVAEALHHAHAHGVVHRDIKPANIMLLESGQPKIMDFGIAKVESGDLTAAGQFFGSPRYMAPEQALAQPVDARTDLFALGSVLYGLLTGRAAFDASEVPVILAQVVRHDPPWPSQLVRDLPPQVDYVVARALAKAPSDRYPNGQAFAEDIEDVLARRPPRHRASWQAPAPLTATMVSSPAPKPPASSPTVRNRPPPVPQPVIQREEAPSRPSWTPRLGFWALGAVIALGLGAFAWWHRRASDEPLSPSTATTMIPARSAAPSSTLSVPPETASLPPQTSAEPARDPAPSLAPPATRPESPRPASPRVKAPAPREPPAPAAEAAAEGTAEASPAPPADAARLLIDFEHSLKSGTMRLWLDDRLVLQEDLEGRVKRKVAGLKWRSGGFEKELAVPPGKHTLRVQVSWEGNDKSDSLIGTLEPGENRRVEIRVGRLRKNVSAEWK